MNHIRVSWFALVVGGVIAGAIALTVHAYMLQGLGIPYPDQIRRTGWYSYPDFLLTTLAAACLYSFWPRRPGTASAAWRCVILFVLIATIKETLIRSWFMELADTTEMTVYPVIAVLPKLLVLGLLSIGIVATGSRKGRFLWAVVISAVVFWACKPVIDSLFERILQALAYLQRPVSYEPPYDYHILIPAYLTFAEPVCGCLAAGLLIRDGLPTSVFKRIGIFALLILLIKGPSAAPFIYATYSTLPPYLAILSVGQFTLEAIALGVLTAITLEVATRAAPPR